MSVESVRLDYPGTTSEDIVLDIGGYRGDFAASIHCKYGCSVVVYEPIPEFFANISKRFDGNPKIKVVLCGVGSDSSEDVMVVKGDSTGLYAEGGMSMSVNLIGIMDVLVEIQQPTVKVAKLNCEGAEFMILEKLLPSRAITRLENIQVQFHPVVPSAESRYQDIQRKLSETHQLTFDAGWVWQNWRLK